MIVALPRLRLIALLAAALILVATGGADARRSSSKATLLLPDLTQQVPNEWGLLKVVDSSGAYWHLGFRSAMNNVGVGPLIVHGHRTDTSQPLLTADQEIMLSDGTSVTKAGVGYLRYDVEPTHQHYHYLGVDRYALRTAKGWRKVAQDRKAGFCLGDRNLLKKLPNTPPFPPPYYKNECDPNDPTALDLTEGISVGWYDNYNPEKEGQYLDVTKLPAGNYYVVHTVNPTQSLRESNYTNNSASALISLSWPGGRSKPPQAYVLAECPTGNACTGPAHLHYRIPIRKNDNY